MKHNYYKRTLARATFLLLVSMLFASSVWAKTIWAPTWSSSNRYSHVAYTDNSTNCTSTLSSYPSILNNADVDGGWNYYMYSGENNSSNPGSLNIDYTIKDEFTIEKDQEYILNFSFNVNWVYTYLKSATAKIALVDGTDATATVLQELESVDLYHETDGYEVSTQTFTANSSGTMYLRITVQGSLEGSIYNLSFANFSISTPPISSSVVNEATDYLTIDKETAVDDEVVTVTYIGGVPNDYHLFGGINVYPYSSSTPLTVTKDGDNYTFVMPTEDVYVYANWLQNLATISLRLEAEDESWLGNIPDQTWTGEEIMPSFQVISSSDDTNITSNVDITFENNVDVGTATAIITAKDNTRFGGSARVTFNIVKAQMEVEAEPQTFTYDGEPHGVTVAMKAPADAVVKYGTVKEECNLDESPTFTNAGTYMVFFQATSTNANYDTYDGSVQLTIEPAYGTLTFAQSKYEKVFGDEPFQIDYTKVGEDNLRFYTYDEKIAKVDSMTGVVTIAGVGTTTIYAQIKDAQGNFSYESAYADCSVEVGEGILDVSATDFNAPYDGQPHGIILSVPEGATVAYGVEDESMPIPADYNFNLTEAPTFTEVGTYYVYFKASKDNYEDSRGMATVTITKGQGSINFTSATKEQTFDVSTCENELINIGDGKVTFTSSNTDVATVDGKGLVTTVGVGTTTITATVEDGANYTYETKTASYTLTIKEAEMLISAQGYSGTYDAEAHSISVRAVSPSDAVIMYGTEAGSYLLKDAPTFTDAGTYTVYYQVTKTGYKAETGSAQVIIYAAAGSMSFTSITVSKTFGAEPFTINPTVVGDGVVTYQSADESIATVDATTGEVTIVGSGQTTITAQVANSNNYSYKPSEASYTLFVFAATMDVVADGYEGIYDGAPHTISVTVNSPEGATIYYGTESNAKVYGKTLSEAPVYTEAGTYDVWYWVYKENYYEASGKASVIINKAQAQLQFGNSELFAIYGEGPIANTIINTGDAEVEFASSNSDVATVDATTGVVTIVGEGEAIISATVVGEGTNYSYETNTAEYTFTVAPATLTASFNGTTATYDGEPHGATLTIDNSEGATVKYGVELDNYNLDEMPTFTEAGSHVVYAQISKKNYETLIIQASVIIDKAQATLSFDNESISTKFGGTSPVVNNLVNTGDAEVLYSSSNENVAFVNAKTGDVTVVAVGEAVITATATESLNYYYQPTDARYILTVEEGTIVASAENVDATYDGNEYGISVEVESPENTVVTYGKQKGVYNFEESPVYTDAGVYEVFYRVAKDNYANLDSSAFVTISKAQATISFELASVVRTYGEEPFVNPIENSADGYVTYSSSDSTVAKVDDQTGLVTLVHVGKATIIATADDSDNYEYKTPIATYEIEVKPITVIASSMEQLVTVVNEYNVNDNTDIKNNTLVSLEGSVTTNENAAEMTVNEIEETNAAELPLLNTISGDFAGALVATDATISDMKVQMNGGFFNNVDSSALVKDLYVDNAAIFLTDLPDNWHVSNDTLYINLLADEVDGVIDGFAIAAHVAITDELKAQYPNIVICVIGELKQNAQVNGFFYDLAAANANKAVRLREVQPIRVDNGSTGGSCKMASTYSDFGVKSAIHKYNYSQEELNKNCRQFTAEEFASGVVAYWLNYKGAGYTGEYTAKWAQGSKYPVLAKSAEDALYGITYNCPANKESLITSAPQFATPKNLITIKYDEKPSAILVDGMAIELGEASASFVMTAGNKTVDIQYAEMTSYTISYMTADGDVLKDAETLPVRAGEQYSATEAQLANIEKDDIVYAYVSGNLPNVAVELGSDNNIALLFAAQSAKTTINFVDVDGTTVLKDAATAMQKIGATFSATEAQLANITKDGVTYKYKSGNLEKQVSAQVVENVITLVFEAISGVTDVANIKADSQSGDMYDILGRKVAKPERGLYIQNGKLKLQK